jgi:hypothetical protein
VIAAVGYPGSVDEYPVNFRIPADAGHGMARLQLSAAWITVLRQRFLFNRFIRKAKQTRSGNSSQLSVDDWYHVA